jgi:hypothetical protein
VHSETRLRTELLESNLLHFSVLKQHGLRGGLLLVGLLLLDLILGLLLEGTLGNSLDNTDGDGLSHITDGKATERSILSVALNAHRLGGDEADHGGITGLDALGGIFGDLTSTLVHLAQEGVELAGNVGSVAIQHGGVASLDFVGVVQQQPYHA